jgi:hypothetical protein
VYDENYDALETTAYNSIKKVIVFFCLKQTTPKEKEVEIPELPPVPVADHKEDVKEEPLRVTELVKKTPELTKPATKKYIICKMILRNKYKSKLLSSIISKHCNTFYS